MGMLEEVKVVRNRDIIEIEFLTEGDSDRFLDICSGGNKSGMTKLFFPKKTEGDILKMIECLSQNQIPNIS